MGSSNRGPVLARGLPFLLRPVCSDFFFHVRFVKSPCLCAWRFICPHMSTLQTLFRKKWATITNYYEPSQKRCQRHLIISRAPSSGHKLNVYLSLLNRLPSCLPHLPRPPQLSDRGDACPCVKHCSCLWCRGKSWEPGVLTIPPWRRQSHTTVHCPAYHEPKMPSAPWTTARQ